jgi:SsrA-binding protein
MVNLAENRKAKFDIDIKETLDGGLVLSGPEVKSVKGGNVSLKGSYITINNSGASLLNAHIGPYKYTKDDSYNPTRTRQVLLTKAEINSLLGKEKGLVIVPLEIYSGHKGLVKIKIGIGRGRKKEDKREYIKTRDAKREAKDASK